MAIKSEIPKGSSLSIIGGVFKAVFNDPAAGKYDFTNYKVGGDRYNVAIPLGLKMQPQYLYFFSQMNFSLSIDEGTFLTAIDPGSVPSLTVRDSTSRKPIFHSPFRLFRYFENSAIDSYHYNLNANAELIGDFQCLLDQVADLVGESEIYAQVSMSVYEIREHKFIEQYKKEVV